MKGRFVLLVTSFIVTFLLLLALGCMPLAQPQLASTPTPTGVLPAATPTATPSPPANLGKLAYVQGGDIWVTTFLEGEPERLTSDGQNRAPRWSPSGEWIAFHKGEDQVWVTRADGSAGYPLNEGATVRTFAWAPREDRLAHTSFTGALMAVDADGSSRQELVAGGSGVPYTGVLRVAWSPGGEWLAYERVDRLQKDRPAERYAGLWRIRADGSQATEVLHAGRPADYEPILAGWSSDGSHILYWFDPMFSASMLADGVPLMALPVDGGEPTPLAESVLAYRDFVVPEPTGTDRIAVVVGGYRGAWTSKVLNILSPTTGQGTALTSPQLAASSPAWSLAGTRLAYVVMPDGGDLVGGETARQGLMARRIWVVNTDGSNAQQLTGDPVFRDEYPLWSADGSYILFGRFDAGDRASLWVVPVGGGDPRPVVDELTPTPGPAPGWFGYYGHMEWDLLFDWWRGPAR